MQILNESANRLPGLVLKLNQVWTLEEESVRDGNILILKDILTE